MEHTQDVKCVAWHPTEEVSLSVLLYSPISRPHRGPCQSSLNNTVQILASSSYDDTIKLYIDDPSEDWFCFNTLTGHTSTVWSLAWEPKGRYLASSSEDHTVRVWKQLSDHRWICALVLECHERAVYSVSWTAGTRGEEREEGDLGWLASTGSDGTIHVWELSVSLSMISLFAFLIPSIVQESNSKELEHKLIIRHSSAHGVNDVNSVVWCQRSGYQDLLATAGDDGMVRVWRMSKT